MADEPVVLPVPVVEEPEAPESMVPEAPDEVSLPVDEPEVSGVAADEPDAPEPVLPEAPDEVSLPGDEP